MQRLSSVILNCNCLEKSSNGGLIHLTLRLGVRGSLPVSGLTWLQLSTMIRFLLWRRKWVLSVFPN